MRESAVEQFVDAHLATFACWDLATFLCHSPNTRAGVHEWGLLLARQEEDVARAIEHLTGSGLLVEEKAADAPPVYRLCDDEAKRTQLRAFVEAARTRERRLDFVRRVIGNLSGA